ncbi:protein of unknown function DUF470 [Acidothermus cellulolyticus 11B]|uniref:Phosphatidylglycerol lysyltransferase C-terminal domain-containing protein n=1 Tax=Acidothermus cellulolyticus (strain ATCC 43068 / DSM 8971 / 11B) TaxID=351607 RepID=A0LRC0_ACIC1|nr:phosphatidylglycerol lysyltransferase domain-containing protein [Acidothermus cellulolyticus]ABK51980.1 protein of unknown function DUF470 [Acidothermus cellulolyticus 11B]
MTREARTTTTRDAARQPVRRRDRRRHRPWVPALAGWVAALVGIRNFIVVLHPHWWERVRPVGKVLPAPGETPLLHGLAAAELVGSGALMLLLAHALKRRKRRAWQVVVGVLAVGLALHVVHHPPLHGIPGWLVIDGGFLIGLLAFRKEFFAEPDPRTRWSALVTFVGLGVASYGFGLVLVGLRKDQLVGHPSWTDILLHVGYGLVGIPGPLVFRTDAGADVVSATLLAMGALTVFSTAYLLLRAAKPRPALTPDDEARMRALLAAHGHRDSLGYFALRRDKSVVWSETGKSCIAYRVVSGVMLVSGDPLGDPEAWPGAIDVFLEQAERHAWVPAVLGCSERAAETWLRHADLAALEIGDEAVIDVADFSLEGRAMRNVRQMVHRVERAGYDAVIARNCDLAPDLRDQLRAAAVRWRDGETERGFAMALGRLGDVTDPDCLFAVAVKDGRPHAFLHFVPWGRDGLSLDVMRWDRTSHPGLNEFLIARVIRAAPHLGIRRISLNFAVFRSALERGGRIGAGPIIRAWRSILLIVSRWVQIESLYRFNAKFRPEWVSRYLLYPDLLDLPRIALAALEAEAFIVWPTPSLRRLQRVLRLGGEP